MNQPAAARSDPWHCRGCRAPLGLVQGGVLSPKVPEVTAHRNGTVRVRCPYCAVVRVWAPWKEAGDKRP